MEFLNIINIRFLFACCLLFAGNAISQDEQREPLYFPEADAGEELAQAIQLAEVEGKHVMVQVGGNWCVWCYRFHDFVTGNEDLSALLEDNYVAIHLNYSRENMNEEILADLGYPQRFGFPVFIILDGRGNRLHTQDSGMLEEEKSYNEAVVSRFFTNWAPAALDPASYE